MTSKKQHLYPTVIGNCMAKSMSNKLKLNDKVKLISFNNSIIAPSNCQENENYWKIIGYSGFVVKSPNQKTIYADFSQEPRILIKFNKNIKDLKLACHNEIENSLWILETDLEII